MQTGRSTSPALVIALSEVWNSAGGIPAFNRELIEAARASGRKVAVTSLNDPPEAVPADLSHTLLAIDAAGGNRAKFLFSSLKLALTCTSVTMLVGHVRLAPIGAAVRLLRPKFRYAVVCHGVEVWTRKGWLLRQALVRADHVVAVSEFTAAKIAAHQEVPADRIFVLKNVLAPDWVDRSGQRGTSPPDGGGLLSGIDGPVLLTTGRVDRQERYKGHDRVIRALPRVLRRVPGVRYVIAGAGDDLDYLRELAEQLGVSSSVDFRGYVPSDVLESLYRSCDIFVMPSTGEGFGIVFLEAMAFGKPVIAGNRDGSREAATDRVHGRVVDPLDESALVDAIVELLENPGLARSYGEAGRARVIEHFTAERFRQDFKSLLDRLEVG